MIRFILTTAFFLVIILLSYNYFFGTAEEKKQAREIFSKGAEVVGAGADLLKSEYQKYQDGKYDGALDNVGHLLDNIKEQSGELFEEIESWNQRKNEWDRKKDDLQQLLDTDPDAIDKEAVNSTITELEKERKMLEIEAQRLQAQAE
jgi:gas vesicle protein